MFRVAHAALQKSRLCTDRHSLTVSDWLTASRMRQSRRSSQDWWPLGPRSEWTVAYPLSAVGPSNDPFCRPLDLLRLPILTYLATGGDAELILRFFRHPALYNFSPLSQFLPSASYDISPISNKWCDKRRLAEERKCWITTGTEEHGNTLNGDAIRGDGEQEHDVGKKVSERKVGKPRKAGAGDNWIGKKGGGYQR